MDTKEIDNEENATKETDKKENAAKETDKKENNKKGIDSKENAVEENRSQALRRISNLASQKDIPYEKDFKGKVRRHSTVETINSDNSFNNDAGEKYSRIALEKSPYFIWLQSEAESFNQ